MATIKKTGKLRKSQRQLTGKSYSELSGILRSNRAPLIEITVNRVRGKFKIPIGAMKLLNEILKEMSQGHSFTLLPDQVALTTQQAAELLGCSRPHVVKLLESGQIDFIKIGRHRRIKSDDLLRYRQKMKANQKRSLIRLMRMDEESGFYET